ncbi:hypothetical protein OROMI_020469 [Orobanche minor]
MPSRKKSYAGGSNKVTTSATSSDVAQHRSYEGENLACLLELIRREIESTRETDTVLPEKVWRKQQFAIGVNEVTRVLERMPPVSSGKCSPREIGRHNSEMPSVHLQAILLASDCNPRFLSKHLPDMANLRGVPILLVKDNKGGSLRLGELLNLKTAIAIGIKVRKNGIYELIQNVLEDKAQVTLED